MVNIWFCKEGKDPTRGEPAYIQQLHECVEMLGLSRSQFLSELSKTPRFGDQEKRLTLFADYKFVVAELSEDETANTGWKAGFYRLEQSPQEVIKVLGSRE